VTPHNLASTGQVSQPQSRSTGNNPAGDTASPAKSSASGQQSTTTIPTSTEKIKDQFSAAGTKTSALSQEGIRQRTLGNSERSSKEERTPTSNITVQRRPVEGVPVQIVAILCLVSFLLAYFFF